MQDFENAVILGAGLGSRLGFQIPKIMVEIHGRKLIEYQLELLKEVPNVFVVVGYKDDEVMKFASTLRKDLIFVRNSYYKQTGVLYSLYLAYEIFRSPCLVFDGDTIMTKENFDVFKKICASHDFRRTVVGVTKVKSDQPIYCKISSNEIIGFSRVVPEKTEFSGPSFIVDPIIKDEKSYIFEFFQKILPTLFAEVEVFEIDTEEDYRRVKEMFKG